MDEVYTLNELLQETAQQERPGERFQIEGQRVLEVHVDEMVWTKLGSMIAYRGDLKFEREGMMDQGFGKFVKRAVTGETTPLTKASGRGVLYLADAAKHVVVLKLQNETIHVNGHSLLAFEQSLDFDIKMIKRVAGMLAGGLFCVQLSGTGMLAIACQGEPLTLRVATTDPVFADPNATVAWSGNLFPELKTDINLKTLLGRGSGETFQMRFAGDGFVIVQSGEEWVNPNA